MAPEHPSTRNGYSPGDRVIVLGGHAHGYTGTVTTDQPGDHHKDMGWTVPVRLDKSFNGQKTMFFQPGELDRE